MTWIEGLCELYEDGLLGRGEFFAMLILRAAPGELSILSDSLPADQFKEVVAWARKIYDNEHPVGDFVSIRGNNPGLSAEELDAIRAWLKSIPD